jgi:hypothetical protein
VQRCRAGWWADDLYWIRGIERSFGPTIPNHLSGSADPLRRSGPRPSVLMGAQSNLAHQPDVARNTAGAGPLAARAASSLIFSPPDDRIAEPNWPDRDQTGRDELELLGSECPSLHGCLNFGGDPQTLALTLMSGR